MSSSLSAQHASADERQVESARAQGPEQVAGVGMAPGLAPAGVLLGLQRMAGNASVLHMLRGHVMPAAPRPPLGRLGGYPAAPVPTAPEADEETPESDEPAAADEPAPAAADEPAPAAADEPAPAEEEPAAADEPAPAEEEPAAADEPAPAEEEPAAADEPAPAEEEPAAADEPAPAEEEPAAADEPAPAEEEPAAADGDEEHSAEDQARKEAEGEEGSESDEHVAADGSAYPIADGSAGTASGAFVDGGRRGTVPFTDALLAHFDPEHDKEPRAFTGGGRSGTKAWAGGGGAGPKGNQKAGSIQNQVEPVYESRMVGPLSNADAWVQPGTGVADVVRNYVSSDAGDQGNGWFVTDKAAQALERHEQRHIAASRDQYASDIQPVIDRVAGSEAFGKGKTYWQSDARTIVKNQIGWSRGLKSFVEADEIYNAPNGNIDTQDYGSANFPRQVGPGSVAGKQYTNRLVMNDESDPK